MMSVKLVDCVTSFSCFKDVSKYMQTFAKQPNFWQDFFSAMAESWKKLKTVVTLFIVCSNGNRSTLVNELLCYNSLFVGQLYKDNSLTLGASDFIFFTSNLQ